MIVKCKNCSKEFNAWPSYIKRGGGKFCSRICRGVAFRGIVLTPQTLFKKGHKQTKGADSPHWKNARTINKMGYIVRTVGGDLVLEHRYIMENFLGRRLESEEVVHHINKDKKDNRIENLELLSSQSEHMKIHLAERWATL